MGSGMIEAGLIAQIHITYAQFLIKCMDLPLAFITNSETTNAAEILSEDKMTTLLIPRDMREQFEEMAKDRNLFYVCPGDSVTLNGNTYNVLDPDPLSEYIQVKTKAPVPILDSDGIQMLDENGNPMWEKGTNRDFNGLSLICNKLTHEYLENKARAFANDPRLNHSEANDKWGNKGIRTMSIKDLSLTDAKLMQDAACNRGIESLLGFDIKHGTYFVELKEGDCLRGDDTPDRMSPGECALSGYILARNVPEVSYVVDAIEKDHNIIASTISEARNKENSYGTKKDITIVYTKDLRFNPLTGAEPPISIRIHDHYAEITRPDSSVKKLDLFDKESFSEVKNLICAMENNLTVLNTGVFSSAVGSWGQTLIDGRNVPIWTPNKDIDLWKDTIGLHQSMVKEFDKLKDKAFTLAEKLREDGRIDLELTDAPGKSYKMIEARIPESDTVIADTISQKFGDKTSVLTRDSEAVDQIGHNVSVTLNKLKISLASHYVATPSFLKKNAAELLLDDKSLGFSHLDRGEPIPPSLSPEEAAQYFESLSGSVENLDPLYENPDYDAYDKFLREYPEEYEEGLREMYEFDKDGNGIDDRYDLGSNGIEDYLDEDHNGIRDSEEDFDDPDYDDFELGLGWSENDN